jgi:hypothetical protein
MQAPWMTQTVGLAISSGRFQAARIALRKERRRSGCSASAASEPRSMPEENIGPAPRSSTQRTSGSAAAARSASPTASTSSSLNAFRFSGRLRTTCRTGPWFSLITSDMRRNLVGRQHPP